MNQIKFEDKSLTWKLVHSWWCILSFFSLGWIGFLFIGFRVKKKIWKVFGIIYTLIYFLYRARFFAVVAEYGLHIRYYSDIKIVESRVFTIYMIVTIIHTFIANPEYLIYLKARQDKNMNAAFMENERTAEQIRAAQRFDNVVSKPKMPDSFEKGQCRKQLNINTCTEEELTTLPGVSTILAKKVMQFRDEHGAFDSVDEFVAYLNLRPKFVEQVKSMVKV